MASFNQQQQALRLPIQSTRGRAATRTCCTSGATVHKPHASCHERRAGSDQHGSRHDGARSISRLRARLRRLGAETGFGERRPVHAMRSLQEGRCCEAIGRAASQSGADTDGSRPEAQPNTSLPAGAGPKPAIRVTGIQGHDVAPPPAGDGHRWSR